MLFTDSFKRFVIEHGDDDIHKLALQAKLYPDIDIPAAIRQIQGRKIARFKLPSWYANNDIIYPKHLSLEQSSSEQTARYKAGLVNGESMADLTGGLGIDFIAFASSFRKATYVEKQTELAELALHNLKVLGLTDATVVNADGVEYLSTMDAVDFIYLDPARRSSTGSKTIRIEDCTPDVVAIDALLDAKAKEVMIKLSPMLDISQGVNSLSNVSDVYVVSVNNECKELLFIKKKEAKPLTFHCVNIKKDTTDVFSYPKDEEDSAQISYTSELGKYLYEPNASIIKAGAYKVTANRYHLCKLHPNSHLYTGSEYIADFQGRKFEILQVCTLNKKDIATYLSNIKAANISTRNFPLSPDEIKRKLKIKDGGDTYLFATTLADEKKVLIICRKA